MFKTVLWPLIVSFLTSAVETEARTEGLVNVDITVSTSKLKETKEFYTKYLKFQVMKETPGFISLLPGPGVAFLDFVVEGAEHACARPQLAENFAGKGMFLTYNLGDVDAACEEFNKSGYPMAMPIRTESWFERHCYVIDPNGIPLNLAHWNETPAEPKGVSSMAFYYTSFDLLQIQNWYSTNLNMTVEIGVEWFGWVITLTAANGSVVFRPFHPKNNTNNPASFIPHLLEKFDGHGLSYTFNFNTSAEVDRWCQYFESRGLLLKRPLGWVGAHKRCAVDDPKGVVINMATPGWNEYEEEVNCPKAISTTPGIVNGASILSVPAALLSSVLFRL